MPDELWTEVHDIVQETGIKTIPMEKKCKKAKWLSGEALRIAVKLREAKSKGEKERYKHLNAEFQRIVRGNKQAFLGYQRKEIQENNRMGKTRDLFKKIRDTKGIFHAKMGSLHGQRSPVGYSPKGREESDTTEQLITTTSQQGKTSQKQKVIRRGGRNTQKNCTKRS